MRTKSFRRVRGLLIVLALAPLLLILLFRVWYGGPELQRIHVTVRDGGLAAPEVKLHFFTHASRNAAACEGRTERGVGGNGMEDGWTGADGRYTWERSRRIGRSTHPGPPIRDAVTLCVRLDGQWLPIWDGTLSRRKTEMTLTCELAVTGAEYCQLI